MLSLLCNEKRRTLQMEDPNPLKTAFREGQRSIILYIRAMLAKKPGEVVQHLERASFTIDLT